MSSSVKYLLLELLPSLSAQAKAISDREIKVRFKFLKAVCESGKAVEAKCREEGKSSQYFYKWAERLLKAKDLLSLRSESRRPKKSPKLTPKRVSKRIKNLRKLEPFSGPERISQDLKEHFNIKCAPSTVYCVLKRENLITKKLSKRLTKKHTKRYRRAGVGYLQMDFKYVPYLIQGSQHYQLSVVDHHSSWRFIRTYPEKSTMYVMAFLKELLEECPFPIIQIQTDNDAAFTDKFTSQNFEPSGLHEMDIWCRKHDIEHRLIPVGQKELNGKVENTHKFDDREFFSQTHCKTRESLAIHSSLYNQRWNQKRRTKALRWRTPLEVVLQCYVRALAGMMYMKHRFNPLPTSPYDLQITDQGDLVHRIAIPKSSPRPVKKKAKKISAVDRYLAYLDWEEKQRIKSLLPLLAMSQIFSERKWGLEASKLSGQSI